MTDSLTDRAAIAWREERDRLGRAAASKRNGHAYARRSDRNRLAAVLPQRWR